MLATDTTEVQIRDLEQERQQSLAQVAKRASLRARGAQGRAEQTPATTAESVPVVREADEPAPAAAAKAASDSDSPADEDEDAKPLNGVINTEV